MEFRLYYRGPLRSNGGREDKHTLRKHFHGQLSRLWQQLPLSAYPNLLERPDDAVGQYPHRNIGRFTFFPLISSIANLVAELDILLLKPEPPGAIVTQGGDIDNRLKTLLDSLKVPHELNALPDGAVPVAGEELFHCLLEDDSLITGLSVRTDRLLDQVREPTEVVLILHVRVKATSVTWGNIGLA